MYAQQITAEEIHDNCLGHQRYQSTPNTTLSPLHAQFYFIQSRYKFRWVTCRGMEQTWTSKGESIVFCVDWYCWWSVYTTWWRCPKLPCSSYRKQTNANERVPSKYTQKVKVEKYFSVIHECKYTRPASPGTCARYVVVNTEKEMVTENVIALNRFATKTGEGVNIFSWLQYIGLALTSATA